jgi:hypothetical protein
MKIGNCFIGSLVLLWKHRANDPILILRARPRTWVPHFMVKTSDGLHHYRVVKNFLPWPMSYLIFLGRFQTVKLEQEIEFRKG